MDKNTLSFLEEFFTFESILGVKNDKKIFYSLGKVFDIDQKELKKLFAVINEEEIAGIVTANDYKCSVRINQYLESMGEYVDHKYDDIISIKGQALTYTDTNKLTSSVGSDELTVLKNLQRNAAKGNLAALRCVGFLRLEGIMLNKNVNAGLECLNKAARWASINAAIELAYYSQDKAEALSILKGSVKDTPFENVAQEMLDKYGVEVGINTNIEILVQSFNQTNLDRELYNDQIVKFLNSTIISDADKRRYLFHDGKAAVAIANELPIGLDNEDFKFNGINLLFDRPEETKIINTVLENADFRDNHEYKPLCLMTDNKYVAASYVKALRKSLSANNCLSVYANEMNVSELSYSSENVILKGLDDNKCNVVFLILRDEIKHEILDFVADFIKSAKRRRFALVNPALTLDLSSIVPILVCDRDNYEIFKNLVDVCRIADFTKAETSIAVRELLESKLKNARVESWSADDSVIQKLANLGMEKADMILTKAIKEMRSGKVELIEERMADYFADTYFNNKPYGFGGKIDEN